MKTASAPNHTLAANSQTSRPGCALLVKIHATPASAIPQNPKTFVRTATPGKIFDKLSEAFS